ncbi:MAG: hypothetical protein H6740_10820 [Alphaproteobacteria bacterium]|nr:hypothetical protein [Alphaproteobacteria bacterium]
MVLALALVAARPPDDAKATAAAQALVELGARDLVDPESPGLRQLVRPSSLPEHPLAYEAWYAQLAARLSPGTPLQQAMASRPAVLGTVRGPDYTRVVYDTSPSLTVVTRRQGGATRVEAVEQSACGLCGEPERFVRDLLAYVARTGDANTRLVLGVEVLADEALSEDRSWRAAYQIRSTQAGYMAWLLHGAEVLDADEESVRVRLAPSGVEPVEERWPVVWERDRWMLDYAGLPEQSLLRLPPAEASSWLRESFVEEATLRLWTPRMRETPSGTLVADDVLYMAPTPGGELLVYTQDIGRSAALLLTLDPDTGEVRRRASMPTLSQRVGIPQERWGSLFVGALSPSGDTLALAAHDHLWLVDVRALELLRSQRTGPAVRALAWAPDGRTLAVGDERGAVRLLDSAGEELSPTWWPVASDPVHALLWPDAGRVVRVTEGGSIGELSAPGLVPGALDLTACCGSVRGAALDPGSGELVVGCAGACDPAYLWRCELLAEGEPEVLADEEFRADDGVVSVDPAGRYRLTPSSRPEGNAALWDAQSGALIAVFAPAPLRAVSWEDDRLWALDAHGRLWRWELQALRGE